MPYKIGVIGAESSKFTEEGERLAKATIREILARAKAEHPDLVFISGRCPIAKCEACGKLKFAPPEAPLEGYFECPICGASKAARMGGIDIFGEATAIELRIPCDIKVPRFNSWSGGFMERNTLIAKDSDELYIIVVREYPPEFPEKEKYPVCFHCKDAGRPLTHKKSGACWTATKFTEFHNKRAEYIII